MNPPDTEPRSSEIQTTKNHFEITTSRQFESWLAESGASLAFSTYQAGMLMFVGTQRGGKLSLFNRQFERVMGLSTAGNTLYAAGLYQLYRFENVMPQGQSSPGGYDQLWAPKVSYITGDLDIHDVVVQRDGRPIFVNTLFSCLATASETHSFQPLWRPPFISRLAAEDRCHLNGLA
ncbi:MAG: DUF4915 domain-containing protein, partial [Kiloniellales bacterium]|nr:DUF4915 domain-containing protein [Kiloniellales bacterium]